MHTGQGSNPGPHVLRQQLLVQTFLPTLVLGLKRQNNESSDDKSCPKILLRPYTCDKFGHGLPEQLPVAGV